MTKILPLLTATDPGHPSFHVVAPSLPGYAWSGGASNRGFRVRQYAEVRTLPGQPGFFPCLQKCKLFNKLMVSLGYSEYVTQGGDWGHWVRFCTFLTLAVAGTDDLNYPPS